ncbi:type I methionyl aminopeptidase [Streptomyces sp. INA 01156]
MELKTDRSIDAMYEAGQVVADALKAVRKAAGVGVSLLELDGWPGRCCAGRVRVRPSWATGRPSPDPVPAVICASVNDAIVHGVPDGYRLRDGDLVSVDFGAELGGWVGDSAISFLVGTPRAGDVRLVETAERALAAGIGAAVVGNRIGDIAHAIGTVCRAAGYGILDGFGGHGIGRRMHEDPPVPNEGLAGACRCGTAWCWRSSPCSSAAAPTAFAPRPTAGPCAPSTARAPPTPNTPSRSPPPAPRPDGPVKPAAARPRGRAADLLRPARFRSAAPKRSCEGVLRARRRQHTRHTHTCGHPAHRGNTHGCNRKTAGHPRPDRPYVEQ